MLNRETPSERARGRPALPDPLAGLVCRPPCSTGRARPTAVPTAARGAEATRHRGRTGRQELLAGGRRGGAGLAGPLERATTLLAVVVASAHAPAATTAA